VNYSWTEIPDDIGQGRDTADPLAFRAAATRVARRLVPALTQTSSRVRGFALVCFGLDAVHRPPALSDAEVDRAFLRFERLVVYAQCCHYEEDGRLPDEVHYAGSRRAFTRLGITPELDLNLPLLLHEDFSGGLWGTYRRPALRLGLLTLTGSRSRPTTTRLTKLGRELAHVLEFEPITNAARVRQVARDSTWRSTADEAEDLVSADSGGATGQEAAVMSTALSRCDAVREGNGRGRPFKALRDAYDAGGGNLALDDLHATLLTEGQVQALEDARALTDLMTCIEDPYRRWVTGSKARLPTGVATHRAWDRARTIGEPDLIDLQEALKADPSLAAVHRQQERVADSRGRESWVLGDPRPGRDETLSLDFSLTAASRIFRDGVEPTCGR
jgi:hypothetical protein